jgi:hypothetical protein
LAHGGSKIDVYHRACAFLDALFERTATVLQTEFNDVGYLDLPTEFRDKMTSGQALVAAGPYRKKFYDQVVNKANTLFDTMQVNSLNLLTLHLIAVHFRSRKISKKTSLSMPSLSGMNVSDIISRPPTPSRCWSPV